MMRNVRGTKDIFGNDILKYNHIVNLSKEISNLYNFKEIIIPIFEFSEVFERNLGDTSDVIMKEVYKFKDRGDNFLSLRPEFTAGVVRAFLTNHELINILPVKFFSYGPTFRYDRPQKGRYRQFNQINFEYFGNENYLADVEILSIANEILNKLNLKNIKLEINSLGCEESRNNFENSLREYFEKYKFDLSDDSKVRLNKNVLRILDSKDEIDKKLLVEAPKINSFYTYNDKLFLDNILDKLSFLNINYEVNNLLVRGLDYYTSTVFEFITDDLGSQSTILAGGRYDNLIKQMGGLNIPAVGFASGIERLSLLFENKIDDSMLVSIVPVSDNELKYCINLRKILHDNSIKTELIYYDKMKKKMNVANKINTKYAIIIGDDELKNNILTVKNLFNGIENKVNIENIISFLK